MVTLIKTIRRYFSDFVAVAFITIAAILFYLPLFRDLSRGIPRVDWCGIYPYIEFFRMSLTEYHQFPLRIPHFGGGYPFIAFPYDISLSPLMLIVLAFGAIGGTKITIFVIVLCGTLSIFYLTRRTLGYNLAGSLFSSTTFLFCSWGPSQYMQSNYEKLYFYLLPLLTVLLIESTKERKFIFVASAVFYIVVVSAGSSVIPIALFLLIFACLNAIQPEDLRTVRTRMKYPAVCALIMLITFCFSMIKLLPMHELLTHKDIQYIHFPYENEYPKIAQTIVTTGRDVNLKKLYGWLCEADSFQFVKSVHFPSDIGSVKPGPFVVTQDRDDYVQMYFGYIPVILAALGCFLYWKKIWRYVVLLIITVLISFGPNSPFDGFRLLWQVHPYVHSIWRLDEYFTFQIFYLIALISGSFFSITDAPKRKKFIWVLIPVSLFSLYTMFQSNRRFLENRIHLRDTSEFSFQQNFFHVKIKDYIGFPEPYQVDQYYYLQNNIGLADWLFGNLAIKTNVTPKYLVKENDSRHLPSGFGRLEANPSYRGEVFLSGTQNRAQLQIFSPHKIRVHVILEGADTLTVNQNYHPGWRSDAGTVYDNNGLLAVALDEAGKYDITLVYVPVRFYAGAAVSLLSFLLAYYFLMHKKKARTDAAG